jgi:hypothetical protein
MTQSPIVLSVEMDWQKECSILPGGVTTTSTRGLARLIDVDESTLREHWKSAGFSPSKIAQTLIQYGFNPAGFFESGIPDGAVTLVIEYYAYDAGKRCTEKAKTVARYLINRKYREEVYRQLGWNVPQSTSKLIGIQRENDALRQELSRLEAENRVLKIRSGFTLPPSKSAPRVTHEESAMMIALIRCGFPIAAISRCFHRAWETVKRHAI